jgi:hypothetical protein
MDGWKDGRVEGVTGVQEFRSCRIVHRSLFTGRAANGELQTANSERLGTQLYSVTPELL